MAKLVFVLVGPRAGQDFAIPNLGLEFKDGIYEHTVTGPADPSAGPIINILGSLYNAHPEGSDELMAAQDAWEAGQDVEPGVDLTDYTKAQLIAYAQEHFNTKIAGSKGELLAQIEHLKKLQDQG